MPERAKGRPRRIERVRGTQDFLPEESARWLDAENKIREIFRRCGYGEIRTPVMESAEVFRRPLGAGSDVVVKEMYEFKDKGGRDLALRPEGTAAVVRAYIEHGLYAKGSRCKLYYLCPIFRYDRPQAGRYRQHHQVGVEVFGDASPAQDAEVVALGAEILDGLQVDKTGYEIRVNSSGCPACRPDYVKALKDFLLPKRKSLCKDCSGYRWDNSPLRILDCKVESCRAELKDAPPAGQFLCLECNKHFLAFRLFAGKLGLALHHDERLVRGLDYYTRTCFEFVKKTGGAQDTLIGGGRYDGLVELLGGPATPGVGWGMGLERVLAESGLKTPERRLDYYIVVAERQAYENAVAVWQWLHIDRSCELAQEGKSFNAQMRAANASRAKFAVIVGLPEAGPDQVVLKDLKSGDQLLKSRDELIAQAKGWEEGEA